MTVFVHVNTAKQVGDVDHLLRDPRCREAWFAEHGTFNLRACWRCEANSEEDHMNGIIYIIGLVVVIVAVLSFFGLR
jgi:hypothetical protein